MKLQKVLSVLVVVGVALASASLARADSEFTSTIGTVGEAPTGCTGGCPAGPYASITVLLTSPTTAIITLNALAAPAGYTYLLGDDGTSVGLNINAANFSVSEISETFLSGFSGSLQTSLTGQNHAVQSNPYVSDANGFDNSGDYDYIVGPAGSFGFSTAATSITLQVTDVGGTWAQATDVVFDRYTHPPNSSADAGAGGFAGVNGYVCVNGAGTCATNSPNHKFDIYQDGLYYDKDVTVPDGGVTLVLLGGALVGLGALRRRFGA